MKYGRTVGPRSDRRSIIITLYTYVYYVCVCVWWTRLRRRRIKRRVHAMCSHIIIIRNLNASLCVCVCIRKSPGGVVVNFNITLICKLVTVTNERRLQRE